MKYVIANHVWADNKYFLADGVFSAKAIKMDNQWRISDLRNNVVWRTGDGMKKMLNTGLSQNEQ